MNLALIDLECTCDENDKFKKIISKIKREEMEIIEIGCVIIDEYGNIKNRFTQFVKPTIHVKLTDFCKNLTHIKQEDVDHGNSLEKSLSDLNIFLLENKVEGWASWGDFDKNKIDQETKSKNINMENHHLSKIRHSNLSVIFKDFVGAQRKMGLGKALRGLKLNFEGQQHRAIDDVINMAKIIKKVNKDKIIITL